MFSVQAQRTHLPQARLQGTHYCTGPDISRVTGGEPHWAWQQSRSYTGPYQVWSFPQLTVMEKYQQPRHAKQRLRRTPRSHARFGTVGGVRYGIPHCKFPPHWESPSKGIQQLLEGEIPLQVLWVRTYYNLIVFLYHYFAFYKYTTFHKLVVYMKNDITVPSHFSSQDSLLNVLFID